MKGDEKARVCVCGDAPKHADDELGRGVQGDMGRQTRERAYGMQYAESTGV